MLQVWSCMQQQWTLKSIIDFSKGFCRYKYVSLLNGNQQTELGGGGAAGDRHRPVPADSREKVPTPRVSTTRIEMQIPD